MQTLQLIHEILIFFNVTLLDYSMILYLSFNIKKSFTLLDDNQFHHDDWWEFCPFSK
jgi:hypothetical protein